MEINLDPGWDETVVNLSGPCKLDITREGVTVAAIEVPSGEVYRLTVKRQGMMPEHFLTEASTIK